MCIHNKRTIHIKHIQGLLSLTTQHTACQTWNMHPSYWGSVPLGQNFTETGSSRAKVLIPFDGYLVVDCATAVPLEVFRQWNFIAEWFVVEISAKKQQIRVSKPHFGKVRHDARPWLMAHWKAMFDFLFVLIKHFSLSITVRKLWGEMCTARLFSQRVDLFTLKFYLDRVVPHQPFLASEN